jgi:hypothetical protein
MAVAITTTGREGGCKTVMVLYVYSTRFALFQYICGW